MVRLAIALMHTVLAAGTTSAALFLFAQARANAVWEQGFYGQTTDGTTQLLAGAVVALLFGLTHGTSAIAWFAGASWGGATLIVASLLLAAGASWALVAVLGSTSALIALDVMVEHHRRAATAAPPRH